MKRIFLVISLSLIFLINSVGQSSQIQNLLPKILPSSPDAASIEKYGSYPVNMYNGLPEISIPIYQIQIGDLQVPISINYHASGIKVSERSSRIGLGWSLNYGSSISRKMMGKPDEQSDNYLNALTVRLSNTINTSNQNDLDYLRLVSNGIKDAEPDIFSYNINGKSGKFLFNQQDNYNLLMLPFEPLKINLIRNSNNNAIFEITNDNGTLYELNEYESTSTNGISNAPATWMVSKMKSSNKNDSINFVYSTRYGQTSEDISDYTVVNDYVTNYAGSYSYDVGNSFISNQYVYVTEKIIQQILFRNGKVEFEYSTNDREDGFPGQKKIESIKIYNLESLSSTYQLLKAYKFNHSYFINPIDGTKRLRLDSLTLVDNTSKIDQVYKFEYNNDVILPSYLSRSRDFWGFYNGKTNSSLVPRMEIPFQASSASQSSTIWVGSNNSDGRETDPYYMSACVLKKIIYPTGGFTTFEFEGNKYQTESGQIKFAGGLRIKSIKSQNSILDMPNTKTYVYGDNNSGYGRANFKLGNYLFTNEQTSRKYHNPVDGYGLGTGGCLVLDATKRVRTFISNPSIEIEPFDGSIVGYSTVTEYEGDEIQNTGKTVNTYSDIPDALNIVAAYGRPILTSYHFDRGQLLTKTVFKKTEYNSYQKIQRLENSYSAFPQEWSNNVGLVVFKWQVSEDENGSDLALGYQQYCPDDRNSFRFMNYHIRSGDNKLIQTSLISYDLNDDSKFVKKTTNYFYENFSNQQITKKEFVTSKNEILTTYYKYPHDFTSIQPYTNMIDNHILNKIVEEKSVLNSKLISLKKIEFQNWGNLNFLPSSVSLKYIESNLAQKINFNSYDIFGNIREVQKNNDLQEIYLWGYKSSYPVAKIIGADQSSINTLISQNFLDNPSSDEGLRTHLNALRSLPNTLVNTYTYKPLVGMTSETDPNGKTTYYEYDNFGRLKIVRDHNNNILKKICYNYAGQTTSCLETPPQVIPQTIYARLSYENVQYSWSTTMADLVVRFYSNAACTLPLSVNNLTINYSDFNDCYGYNNNYVKESVNGNTVVLGYSVVLDYSYTECDYGYWPCYTYYCHKDYSLAPGNYVVVN